MSAIVDIERTHYTSSGARYRVLLDGAVIVKSCRDVCGPTARALSAMGVTGRVQFRRLGHKQIDMEGLIAVLATKTVTEGDKISPRLTKWQAHFMAKAAE
jgi:hypothetical protein